MDKQEQVKKYREQGRYIEKAVSGDEELGPLKLLPGTWKNTDEFHGRGWNMIAVPFISDAPPDADGRTIDYRLLVNQFNETLEFKVVDKGVPNRGIERGLNPVNTDQFLVTLDYEQTIRQIAADDRPLSGLAGDPDLAIHHEPGLWLNMTNLTTNNFDIARLGTIPHGDSVLALGTGVVTDGAVSIPDIEGLPDVGVPLPIESGYLAPYKHYKDNPFEGVFDPTTPNSLIQLGSQQGNVKRTTTLEVSTTVETAGISNIPFIVKQANAVEMNSTFWIQEMEPETAGAESKLRIIYSQVVMLDFFEKFDGSGELIRWPHVSINMMERVFTNEEPTS